MKTTIDIPDDLFVAAKRRAAELRQPLKALVEESLRARLREEKVPRKRKHRRIRFITVAAGLPKGLDVGSREAMHEWLRARR